MHLMYARFENDMPTDNKIQGAGDCETYSRAEKIIESDNFGEEHKKKHINQKH